MQLTWKEKRAIEVPHEPIRDTTETERKVVTHKAL